MDSEHEREAAQELLAVCRKAGFGLVETLSALVIATDGAISAFFRKEARPKIVGRITELLTQGDERLH